MKKYLLLLISIIVLIGCIYIVNKFNSDKTEYITQSVPITDIVNVIETDAIDITQAICLATNIYHEARGESYAGKVAVANVTMNRVHSPKFPNTICNVVYQAQTKENWKGNIVPKRNKCQFSWYCDGKSDDIILVTADGKIIKERMLAWEMSQLVANQSIRGNLIDITDGSTHYFNSELANPYWAKHLEQVVQIDSHSFLRTN
tara:strand:- start:1433 stop:2041 length:609 start_codon:yes stop_codon:yes gene_type:complete